MRLVSLELNGFRGFPQRHVFDLDADAIVLIGANGHGKTSFFDAILWALSGLLPRLNNDDSRLVSMYSETGQARVALRLKDHRTDDQFTVTRSFDGTEGRIALETPDGSFHGPSAEGRLIDLLWPDAASASNPREALASVLTRSVYLQQDLIRQFVEAASDQERFAAVSELVGAGRVAELQGSLEREKKAWSTVTNQRRNELSPLRERLNVIEARLSELTARPSQGSLAIAAEYWDQWWQALSALGIKEGRVEPASREAPIAIDYAIKRLEPLRLLTERRLQTLSGIQTELAQLASDPAVEITVLQNTLATARRQLEEMKVVVTTEQTRLAELRRNQATLEERSAQLRALAVLALKHLDNGCPVCGQEHDKVATRLRLESMISGVLDNEQNEPQSDNLPTLLAGLEAKENEVATAESSLRVAEQLVAKRQSEELSISKRLADLGVGTGDNQNYQQAVGDAISRAVATILSVAELQNSGESLALRLSQSSAKAASDELRREADTLRDDIKVLSKVISDRDQTGELAQRVIEALREAASAVVEERLSEIGPLLQSIYARIDPHPAFRLVSLLSRVFHGKGHLSTIVSDPIENKQSDLPVAVLSSSQVNALAVCLFLALNLGVSKPPLEVAMLDDPIQSLDDINLLGLLDLLRRTKDRRQLCVSTHDGRFGSLLARKLRPANEGRTIVLELNGWSRQGPIVLKREVKSDPVPLRLVASMRD